MDDDKAIVPPDLRDAAYTAIGLAVLGMQRVQVFRRDVERFLRHAKGRIESQERANAAR